MSASKAPAVPPTAPVVAGPSSARKQPMRQTRTARKPSTSKPTPNGVESFAIPSAPDKFYSCLHAFTDAIDALPSEIIRHFTLLREVDAKACLPEYHLRTLIDTLDRLPAPADPYEFDAALEALKQLDELRRRRDNDPTFQHNAEQVELLAELEKIEAAEALLGPNCRTILGQPETRRAKCHQIRGQIQDILGTQEEKVHVIGTAVEALNKQMSRVDHAFAYTETEIPQIYRLGNPNHWAYMEPMKKGTAAQIAREKQREQREQEERLHQLAMESNVRGGGRNNNSKNSHHHYAHHQQQEEHEPAKKRVRKTGDNETLSSTKRIVDQQAGAQQQQAKKRKTATTKEDKEKAAAAAAAAKGTASPRASTPVPKKAKTAGQRAPRSRTAQTPTASATNSPLLGQSNLAVPHIQPFAAAANASPLNNNTSFTAPSTTSAPQASPLPAATAPAPTKSHKKDAAKQQQQQPPAEPEDIEMLPAPVQEPLPPPPPKVSHKKKQRAPTPAPETGAEEHVPKKVTPTVPSKREKEKDDHHTQTTNTKTKNSNSNSDHKSNAASSTTPGANRNRKRADSTATAASVSAAVAAVEPAKKKSHKAKSQQKPPIGLGISTAKKDTKEPEESGEEDEGEETYCYCDQISYGEMVACDGEDCEREWFHLECAGLTMAPKGKVKWYCRDCELVRARGRSRA